MNKDYTTDELAEWTEEDEAAYLEHCKGVAEEKDRENEALAKECPELFY